MISFIKGKLYSIEEGSCIIENNGIGYELFCSKRDIEYLSRKNIDSIQMYTILIHREDIMELYGFLQKLDLSIFKLLLLVRGIGPKQAIKILSEAKSEDIISSIYNEDSKFLKEISGIGKKKAEQIILELKERIKKRYNEMIEKGNIPEYPREKYFEVEIALESLGFTKREIKKALEGIDKEYFKEVSTAELIQKALNSISDNS